MHRTMSSINPASEEVRRTPVTASRELAAADLGQVLEVDPGGGAVVLTAPASLGDGWNTTIVQVGTGTVSVAAGGGATVRSNGGALTIAAQWAGATIYCRGSSEYVLQGGLV